MPSLTHEALVALFRNRPSLGPELLRTASNTALPEYKSIQISEADLTNIVPTEMRADLVLKLLGDRDQAHGALVIEAHLSPVEEKRWTWPAYIAVLRHRWRCPVVLVVVTTDQATAKWAGKPIEMLRDPLDC